MALEERDIFLLDGVSNGARSFVEKMMCSMILVNVCAMASSSCAPAGA
jgi:hypothetical protein